jgi:CHAD domain-containing protein
MSANRSPSPAYEALGVQALSARLAALLAEGPGLRRRADPEHLHRMRVASRRLRAAARLFGPCWPRAWRPRWRRELRRLTRALGAARDLDVQLIWLGARLAGLPGDSPERPGLARLHLRLEQAREQGQRHVTRALTRFESRTAPELAAFLARRHGFGPVPAPTADACAAARAALAPLLAELLAHAPRLPEPAAAAEHHALRIAAKRLRYALEIFEPLDPAPLGAALHGARRLQSKLGDLHDCDVWIAFVPGFLEEERRRTLEYFGEPAPFAALRPGLLALAGEQARRRPVLHAECVALWNDLDAQGVWGRLAGAPADPDPARPDPDPTGTGPDPTCTAPARPDPDPTGTGPDPTTTTAAENAAESPDPPPS